MTDFPDGFLWGAATAAHQVEGGNTNNDWWDFEHDPASPAGESSEPAPGEFSRASLAHYRRVLTALHPDGLRRMLHRAAGTGLPLYVTENGIATTDDTERVAYLHSHLAAVAQALAEGVDVRGYLHWSAFDNFEWSEGYRPRFGLIAVDRVHFTRLPKPSAHAFARVAGTGRLHR